MLDGSLYEADAVISMILIGHLLPDLPFLLLQILPADIVPPLVSFLVNRIHIYYWLMALIIR